MNEIELEKPKREDREYSIYTLDNGLTVCLVKDDECDKAAARMSVKAGFYHDFEKFNGLAHFCEHMLFLNTEKYPKEGEYGDYIKKNGGMSNAYTAQEDTNYYFQVNNNALEEALDRFAQFFISPLFTKDGTSREIDAIQSEYEKNIQTDYWKNMELYKLNAIKDSPFTIFGMGNKNTLLSQGVEELRDALFRFHKKYYSAKVMTLTICSNLEMGDLKEIVAKYFSEIVSFDVDYSKSKFSKIPFEKGCWIESKSIKNLDKLMINFPIPYLQNVDYLKKSHDYIGNLLAHEGKGSLLQNLKDKFWATALISDVNKSFQIGDFSSILIEIHLTKEGFKNLNDVIKMVFSYITILKNTAPSKILFKELENMAKMKFEFFEKKKPLSSIMEYSDALNNYDPRHMLSHKTKFKYDEEHIMYLLNFLTPEKAIFHLSSKNEIDVTNFSIEEHFGTPYSMSEVDPNLIESLNSIKLKDIHENLHIPEVNKYIPESFDMIEQLKEEEDNGPTKILSQKTPYPLDFFVKGNKFNLPKGFIGLHFKLPLSNGSPETSAMNTLFTTLLDDIFSDEFYSATLAGLNVAVSSDHRGFLLICQGFSDKLISFFESVLEHLKKFNPSKDKFDTILEKQIKRYDSELTHPPYHLTMHSMAHMFRNSVLITDLIEALKSIDFESFNAFVKLWMKTINLACLVEGNFKKDEIDLVKTIIDKFVDQRKGCQQDPFDLFRRVVKLEDKTDYFANVKSFNSSETNSCMDLYYHIGYTETNLATHIDLFNSLISSPFFNELRTVQQLGYIVHCAPKKFHNVMGMIFLIQGTKKTPKETFMATIQYIEEFIEKDLNALTNEEFQIFKDGLMKSYEEKNPNFSSECFRHFGLISNEKKRFDYKQLAANALKKIELKPFIQTISSYFKSQSSTRFCVFYHTEQDYKKLEEEEKLHNLPEGYDSFVQKKTHKINDISSFYGEQDLLTNKHMD